ncbi:MAG: amidohydrolase [Alphaproteobacteria bacterium]|nr:amidohydrolase [Alphaproteobacteria bacterium]MCB9696305.1 amidohydrolase [Alphaproteobacteria bacterium]
MTAAGDVFPRGYVVLEGGRIRAVGEGDPPETPGAVVVDVSGRFVTPGLIDTHSHLGVYPSPGAQAHADGNEMTAPTTPGVWAEHSTWPQDPGFERAVAGGITTLQILPGSANLIGGRGFVARPIPARGSRAMAFPDAPQTVKMACGENPKRVYGEKGGPQTRMGNLRGQREAFIAAQAYERRWEAWEEKQATPETGKRRKHDPPPKGPDQPPDRDLDMETLVGVLRGEILPQIHCYMADDMLSMLQLADEFGFSVRSFHHATEAYKIRDVLAERHVAASVWADWWGFKLEAYDAIPEGAALLSDAGVDIAIHSDSDIGIQRLNQEASKAMASGRRVGIAITEDEALRWITAEPAWILGIDDQTGTLEAGKRADVVVWSANPFSVLAQADLVYVDGALRYDRAAPTVWSDFLLGQGVTP